MDHRARPATLCCPVRLVGWTTFSANPPVHVYHALGLYPKIYLQLHARVSVDFFGWDNKAAAIVSARRAQSLPYGSVIAD